MERNLSIFLVLRVMFTLGICIFHANEAHFIPNSLLSKILDLFYLGVDGHFMISGWLNGQQLESLFKKFGV